MGDFYFTGRDVKKKIILHAPCRLRKVGCGKIISTAYKLRISAQHVVAINRKNWYKLWEMKVVK